MCPGLSESYYGYGSFSDLLEEAQTLGFVTIRYDQERGSYAVRLPGE